MNNEDVESLPSFKNSKALNAEQVRQRGVIEEQRVKIERLEQEVTLLKKQFITLNQKFALSNQNGGPTQR